MPPLTWRSTADRSNRGIHGSTPRAPAGRGQDGTGRAPRRPLRQVRRANRAHPRDAGRLPHQADPRRIAGADGLPALIAARAGPHALLSGTAYLDRDPALPYAYEALEDLRSEVGHTTHYARRDGAHVLYLASRDRRDTVRLFSRVGRRLPAHLTALGQSLLAALTPEEVNAVLPRKLEAFTPNTITSHTTLHTEL